jgi:hypothetical protein
MFLPEVVVRLDSKPKGPVNLADSKSATHVLKAEVTERLRLHCVQISLPIYGQAFLVQYISYRPDKLDAGLQSARLTDVFG